MRAISGVLIVALAGCWAPRLPSIPPAQLIPWNAPAPTGCPAAAPSPARGPAPRVEGRLHLASVQGAPRLWLTDGDVAEWSNDGTHVAIVEHGGVSLWSTSDGSLETQLAVPGISDSFFTRSIQWSNDDRTLLLTGHDEPYRQVTLVVPVNDAGLGSLRYDLARDPRKGRSRFGSFTLARRGSMTVELVATQAASTGYEFRRPYESQKSGLLILRTENTCFEIGDGLPTDVVTFSEDGSSAFIVRRDHLTSLLVQRSTKDGRALHAWQVKKVGPVVPVPTRDVVYLFVEEGLRVADGTTGKGLRALRAPITLLGVDDEEGVGSSMPMFERPGGPAGLVIYASKGDLLLGGVGPHYSEISIVNLRDPSRRQRVQLGDGIERFALSPSQLLLAIGSVKGAVQVHDRDGGAVRWSSEHRAAITALAFSRDGNWLASASRDGIVKVMAVDSGELRGTVELQADRANVLTWTGDHTLVVDTRRGQVVTVQIDE